MFQSLMETDLEDSSLALLCAETVTEVGEERKATHCGETCCYCFLQLLWSD